MGFATVTQRSIISDRYRGGGYNRRSLDFATP